MKRFVAALCALALALCLSPAAFADTLLSKPDTAQMIYITTEDFESYKADFYLCALSSLAREGDDLALYFDNSRIVLRGFFATRDNRRSFRFSDGAVISAANFDESGAFTGRLYSGTTLAKSGAAKTLDSGTAQEIITVKKHLGTSEISSSDGHAVYGEKRALALAAADALTALGCSWNDVVSMSFEMLVDADGGITMTKETVECVNGVVVTNRRPSALHAADSGTLVPVAAGRSSVTYHNALGEELARLSVRVTEENGELTLNCPCPQCGTEQGGKVHILPCGHFSCATAGESGHAVAECGIAGHCKRDGGQHAKCTNCLKPLCTGGGHGTGICEHQHTWQQASYRAPSATAAGESVAKCIICGITYTQVLPALGG